MRRSVTSATWPVTSITHTGLLSVVIIISHCHKFTDQLTAGHFTDVDYVLTILIVTNQELCILNFKDATIFRDYRTSGSAGVCAQCRILPWCQSFSFRCISLSFSSRVHQPTFWKTNPTPTPTEPYYSFRVSSVSSDIGNCLLSDTSTSSLRAQRHPAAKVRRKVSSKNHQSSPHWKSTHQASLKGRIAHENAPKDTKITLCNWWCWWCLWGWWCHCQWWTSPPASTGWSTENQCHQCWW